MKSRILVSLLLLAAFILISCSGAETEISGTWKKPGFSGKKYTKILVVAISNDIVKRNAVETAVVNELSRAKIKSTTSSMVLNLSVLEKDKDGNIDTTKLEEAKKTLSDGGYDGALVLSLLDIKEKTEYVPGQSYYQPNYYTAYRPYGYGYGYNRFYDYSYTTYSVVNTPGYYVEKRNIFIETRLFDLIADDLMWATQTETLNPSNMKEFTQSLAKAVVNSLLDDKAVR